jgi:hypothetical protein
MILICPLSEAVVPDSIVIFPVGYASRLINVISGFGQFNIRISWENQIVANFIGRINAKARTILDERSVFWLNDDLMSEITYLWLMKPENKDIYEKVYNAVSQNNIGTKNTNKIKEITDFYLNTDNDTEHDKYTECIEVFAENVLSEITIPSSDYASRQSFSLFFRTHASEIREELYREFKDLITDDEFDMYIRKAYMQYDV